MAFKNVEEIATYFEIQFISVAQTINDLKSERNKIHPDKNGGEFKSDIDRKKYHDLNEALDWLDKNNQLMSISQITDLVKVIAEIQKTERQKYEVNEVDKFLSDSLETKRLSISKSFQLPKIAVSTLSGVVSFLWFFPRLISEHPLLGRQIELYSSQFTTIWLASLALTIYLWLYSYIKDFNLEKLSKKLESSFYQKNIFSEFILTITENNDRFKLDGYVVFSKSKLASFILKNINSRYRLVDRIIGAYTLGLILRPTIDIDIAEKLAQAIIQKQINRKVVLNYENRSLEDLFKTNIDFNEIEHLRENRLSS